MAACSSRSWEAAHCDTKQSRVFSGLRSDKLASVTALLPCGCPCSGVAVCMFRLRFRAKEQLTVLELRCRRPSEPLLLPNSQGKAATPDDVLTTLGNSERQGLYINSTQLWWW